MHRRRRHPPAFLLGDEPLALPATSHPEFDPLCRVWALRALVDLGAHQKVVHGDHVSEPHLLRFLGVELPEDFSAYDGEAILKLLRERHRALVGTPTEWPQQGHLRENVSWLQSQLGLCELEVRILMLAVLARHHIPLGQAMNAVGSLNNMKLFSGLATLLGAPLEEVARVLQPHGALMRSGLMRLDESGLFDFTGKLELLNGLDERLQARQDNPFDLFADNFVLAPAATLEAARFDHLQPRLGHLQQYLRHAIDQRSQGVNVLVFGPPGTGKTELARTLARSIGVELFEVSVSRQHGARIAGADRLPAYALSQQILARRGTALVSFDEIEDIEAGEEDDFFPERRRSTGMKGWLNKLLESNPVPSIWISNRIDHIDAAHLRRFDVHLEVGTPPAAVRARMLAERALPLGASEAWCRRISANERLGPAVIARSAGVAAAMQQAGVGTPVESLMEELMGASLAAQRLPSTFAPPDGETIGYQLGFINASIDLARVLQGLRQRPKARLLLHGQPGTGKSAFAQHLARELGMPAVLQRASDLLSRYVGETEAQIAQAFRRAAEERSVLILDEVDSFLSPREGAVRSWEVTAVNEMLTQMEAFDGLFVATTNLIDRLDAASLRRFDAKIEFDFLQARQVEALLREACANLGIEACGSELQAHRLQRVTPGDFAMVLRQSRFNPVRDLPDLCGRLREEVALKRQGSGRSIGFVEPHAA